MRVATARQGEVNRQVRFREELELGEWWREDRGVHRVPAENKRMCFRSRAKSRRRNP